MKKHIILLSAAGLLFSSCGVYTKYKPATEVPDGLYGEEIATFTESTDGSPVAPEDSLDLGLGGMDWHELFTDPHLQALIEQGLQNNTDYQSGTASRGRGRSHPAVRKACLPALLCPCAAGHGEQL